VAAGTLLGGSAIEFDLRLTKPDVSSGAAEMRPTDAEDRELELVAPPEVGVATRVCSAITVIVFRPTYFSSDLALSPLYAELTQGVVHPSRHTDLAVPRSGPKTSYGNLSRVHLQPRNLCGETAPLAEPGRFEPPVPRGKGASSFGAAPIDFRPFS